MKLKILKNESKEMELEVEGEGHTFCNVVQEAILEEKAVEFAGYSLPHPLVSHPTIYVRTKGRTTPTRVFERALKNLEKRIVEFNKEFNKSWEKNHQ